MIKQASKVVEGFIDNLLDEGYKSDRKNSDLVPHISVTKVSPCNFQLYDFATKKISYHNTQGMGEILAKYNPHREASSFHKMLQERPQLTTFTVTAGAMNKVASAKTDPWELVNINGHEYFVDTQIEKKTEEEEKNTKKASLNTEALEDASDIIVIGEELPKLLEAPKAEVKPEMKPAEPKKKRVVKMFKCPDCGCNVLMNTKYCMKCKKKVTPPAEGAKPAIPGESKKEVKPEIAEKKSEVTSSQLLNLTITATMSSYGVNVPVEASLHENLKEDFNEWVKLGKKADYIFKTASVKAGDIVYLKNIIGATGMPGFEFYKIALTEEIQPGVFKGTAIVPDAGSVHIFDNVFADTESPTGSSWELPADRKTELQALVPEAAGIWSLYNLEYVGENPKLDKKLMDMYGVTASIKSSLDIKAEKYQYIDSDTGKEIKKPEEMGITDFSNPPEEVTQSGKKYKRQSIAE